MNERPPVGTAPVTKPQPSPCNSVCQMHEPTGWCRGCARTLDEIAGWSVMPDDAKARVWQALPARRVALKQALDNAPRA